MNGATVLLEYTFLSFQKKGCRADGLKLSPFLIMLPHYGRTGAGLVSCKELFYLVFMIRRQIYWSPFLFKVIQQG